MLNYDIIEPTKGKEINEMKLRTYSIFYREKRKSQIFETSVTASNKKEATEYAKEDLKGYTITRISWDRLAPA